jgi:hypothetical protein
LGSLAALAAARAAASNMDAYAGKPPLHGCTERWYRYRPNDHAQRSLHVGRGTIRAVWEECWGTADNALLGAA